MSEEDDLDTLGGTYKIPITEPSQYCYQHYSFEEAKKKGYPMFIGDHRRTFLLRAGYFIKMADAFQIPLDKVRFRNIFEFNSLPAPAKSELNKLAVHLSDELNTEVKITPFLNAMLVDKLNCSAKSVNDSQAIQASQVIENLFRQAQQYNVAAQDKICEAHRKIAQLGQVKDIDLAQQINEVIQDGFYKLTRIDIDLDEIDFITKPICLTHFDEAAGLDLIHNIPPVSVTFRLHRFDFVVKPHLNTTRYQDYFHPYISSGGIPCWGDLYSGVKDCALRRDVKGFLFLLKQLLTYFNPTATPYVSLDKLVQAEVDKMNVARVTFLSTNASTVLTSDFDQMARNLNRHIEDNSNYDPGHF